MSTKLYYFTGTGNTLKTTQKIADKIVDGKLSKFYKENCLMNQQYVKDTDKTVTDYLNEVVAKIGEKISIKRYERFQIGES